MKETFTRKRARAQIEEYIAEHYADEEITLLDDLDDCIIGFTTWEDKTRAVYNSESIIEQLMRDMSWDRCDAVEFYDYNVGRLVPYINIVLIEPIGEKNSDQFSEPGL